MSQRKTDPPLPNARITSILSPYPLFKTKVQGTKHRFSYSCDKHFADSNVYNILHPNHSATKPGYVFKKLIKI